MTISVRAANIADIDTVVELLIADAEQREETDPVLWKVAPAARDKIYPAVKRLMETSNPLPHQGLLLAEVDGKVVGISHTLVLEVPSIYAGGSFGPPGLILEDCYITDHAPEGTYQALIEAAEVDLLQAGAGTLLGQSAAGRALENEYEKRGYEPLTLYLVKTGLRQFDNLPAIRKAVDSDIEDIVTASAEHRRILNNLNSFWKPSNDANARFTEWMRKSLTLTDRDMFVAEAVDDFQGYAISQPATHLHFPLPHDISTVGGIDDYYHADLVDPAKLPDEVKGKTLLNAAEAALEARGNNAAYVVCPAAWRSKIKLLESLGYNKAITWFKKS